MLMPTSKLEFDADRSIEKVQEDNGVKYIDASDTKWIVDDEVYEIAGEVKKIMEDLETAMFDGVLIGRCGDPAIAPWWSKG